MVAFLAHRSRRSTACYASSLYGGTGGGYFTDKHSPCPSRVSRIYIYYDGRVISGFRAVYRYPSITGAMHGRARGKLYNVPLYHDEAITAVVGMVTHNGHPGRVFQLAFVTCRPNGTGRVLGPYGKQTGSLFIFHAHVVSFRGRSGHDLDAIGFYYTR